ncbi:hypothetical protein CN514_06495 [Bacillus sp. AFS001701]|nr:hypothetical protein CN514_06495 [Bacillus sp. AFS001701]
MIQNLKSHQPNEHYSYCHMVFGHKLLDVYGEDLLLHHDCAHFQKNKYFLKDHFFLPNNSDIVLNDHTNHTTLIFEPSYFQTEGVVLNQY